MVMLNPVNVAKFNQITSQNDSLSSTSPIPPPPPRGLPATNPGGTVRRPTSLSDFVDNPPAERRPDQSNTAALEYDHDFENRFRFTPIENLPPPESWRPQPLEAKSSKPINVN